MLLAYVRLHILPGSGPSWSSFERFFFQKPVQIMQQNIAFCKIWSEKPMRQKNGILKILRGFSSIFEDRKRLFRSFFDSKRASPPKGTSGTLAKCFVLYHLGDRCGFYPFLTLFFTFSVFFSFSLFFRRRQKCVPRLRKTYISLKKLFLLISIRHRPPSEIVALT